MPNRQWLTVGASALITGVGLSIILPSAKPIAVVAATTAGAVGGTLLTKSKKTSTSVAPNLSNPQIIGSLDRLEHLIIDNKSELIVIKSQLDDISSSIAQSQPDTQLDQVSTKAIEDELEQAPETSRIIDWLESCNFAVDGCKEPKQTDALFDRAAISLGEQYTVLQPFHQRIKRSIDKGEEFVFWLRKKSKDDINHIASFCELLNNQSFLPCRYFPSQKKIVAKPPTHPDVINFLTGDWFESFVHQQVCDFLSKNGLDYTSLKQITGTLADGRDFELDLLFWINNQPLWIECKSGQDYNDYLTKYSQFRKYMKLPKERALLVIADLNRERAADYTSLWEITVASMDGLIEVISHSLGLESPQEHRHEDVENIQAAEQVETSEVSAIGKSGLLAFLNKRSLNPYPEYRKEIIKYLISEFDSSSQLLTVNQLKDRLSETVQLPNISKTKISYILRALMRSNCFLEQDGESVPTYNTPISSILSLDPKFLEQKCIETYALTVLSVNPNYFDKAKNREEFRNVTSGEIPDRKLIAYLIDESNLEAAERD